MQTNPALNPKPGRNYETIAWKWMRYSALLLIPLVWGHILLQDIIVGVHRIDLDYVALRWASLGWRIYDILLLGFAFAHGVNGLRQVALDYIHGPRAPRGGMGPARLLVAGNRHRRRGHHRRRDRPAGIRGAHGYPAHL